LIDNQFLASIGRPTDSGFAQPEVLANLRCRQTQIPNRPGGQNTAGTEPIGLFPGDNQLIFFKEDGMPPCPADCLQILRYLLASEECTVFLVMSSASYPMLSRIKLIEELSRLQCKLNLVFSNLLLNRLSLCV